MNIWRWSHAHTAVGGVLAGLVIAEHTWWIAGGALLLAALMFLAGVLVGRVWLAAHRATGVTVQLVDAKVATEHARAEEVRARAEAKRAAAEATKKKIAERERLAYVRGAEDVLFEQASAAGERRAG